MKSLLYLNAFVYVILLYPVAANDGKYSSCRTFYYFIRIIWMKCLTIFVWSLSKYFSPPFCSPWYDILLCFEWYYVLDSEYVTCGSAIKLTHIESGGKSYLHSNEFKINSGSGQQLVTVGHEGTSISTLWLVKEGNGNDSCTQGEKIAYGEEIRLAHLQTGANLHSHYAKSPLTNQQEVTCFGEEGHGDSGDNWKVQGQNKQNTHWRRDEIVHLKHVETDKYLGSTKQAEFNQRNCGGRCPVMSHLEVFARARPDKMTEWKTELGVYLHK